MFTKPRAAPTVALMVELLLSTGHGSSLKRGQLCLMQLASGERQEGLSQNAIAYSEAVSPVDFI